MFCVAWLLYFPKGNTNRVRFYIKFPCPSTQLIQLSNKSTDIFKNWFQMIFSIHKKYFFLPTNFILRLLWNSDAPPYSHTVLSGRNIFSKHRWQNQVQKNEALSKAFHNLWQVYYPRVNQGSVFSSLNKKSRVPYDLVF